MKSKFIKRWCMGVAAATLTIAHVSSALAQPTPGYYDTANTSTPATLRSSLHEIIDDHTWFPYTATATDTWDILEIADENMDNPNEIVTIYRNANYAKEGGGNSFYNREHTWPKSYGFPNLVTNNYPYTDTHHLFLADSGYNSSRSNKPFRFCNSSCSEKTTSANNGRGGAGGGYPGDSNWTTGSFTQGTWEVWAERRGDIARAQFYMDVRYEGGNHGITGAPEPDLILTDDEALIDLSNTGNNESVAYMGMLSVLLQWHFEDPVDIYEIQHNEAVAQFQGNRNPFVDHPEWVACIFQGDCSGGPSDTTPPATPAGLTAVSSATSVDLDWADNTDTDLAGYHVYRSTSSGAAYTRITGSLLTASNYADSSAVAGVTYYYVVTAVDTSFNESGNSNEASGMTTGGGTGGTGAAWINEFHYDNSSTDRNEFVEIAGPAGMDLSGWTIVGYNGNGGGSYATISLSGSLVEAAGCIGTASVDFAGMQNGSPDGLALIDAGGQVVEFISYEGSFTATSGPAAGVTSQDIGVAEDASTGRNDSLQRGGIGGSGSDFFWQAPQRNSRNGENAGQTFDGCNADVTPPAIPGGISAIGLDAQVLVDWNTVADSDLAGYNVYRSVNTGGPYSQINGTLLGTNQYTDSNVLNGTAYYYVVTSVDTSGNESAFSAESSATPQAPISGGVWINEFHYDNASTDTGEFIEIAGPAGLSVSGWQLVGYNGNGGTVYQTINLSGVIPEQQNQYGTLAFDFTGLQNGAPDGIALIDNTGAVVEFISYEGTLTATSGPASGMTSTDVGVSETTSTPVGHSIQRSGIGASGSDFVWNSPAQNTRGSINTGQTLGL